MIKKRPTKSNSKEETLAVIDRKVTELTRKMRRLEPWLDPYSAASWQKVWEKHPDVKAEIDRLYKVRGRVQQRENPRAKNPSLFSLLRRVARRAVHRKLKELKQAKRERRKAIARRILGAPKKQPRARRTSSSPAPATASPSVIQDVASALFNQGVKHGAEKIARAAAAKTGATDFAPVFREAVNLIRARNPQFKVRSSVRSKVRRHGTSPSRPGHSRRAKRRPGRGPRTTGKNPGGTLEAAAKVYERFIGKRATKVTDVEFLEPEDDYAGLGKLFALKVKGLEGGKCLTFDSERDVVRVASNSAGTQLYLIGGCQDVTGILEQQRFDLEKDLIDVGPLTHIAYIAAKKMHGFTTTEYWHAFGEEGGELPELVFDKLKKRLHLVGGSYKIKPEGIVN